MKVQVFKIQSNAVLKKLKRSISQFETWVLNTVAVWNLFRLFYALIWRNSLTGIFYLLGFYYFSHTRHHLPPLSHLFSFLLQMIEALITDCSSLYLEKWNIKQIGCCQRAALNFFAMPAPVYFQNKRLTFIWNSICFRLDFSIKQQEGSSRMITLPEKNLWDLFGVGIWDFEG